MVERWKELRDVKGHHARLEFFGPPSSDEMGEENPSIPSGTLGDTSELIRLEGAMCTPSNCIRWESIFPLACPTC